MPRDYAQGSVLGLLLWNICFDTVLIAADPNGEHSVCCADDTQLISEGSSWTITLGGMEVVDAAVDMAVKNLGPRTSPRRRYFYGSIVFLREYLWKFQLN